MIAPRRRYSPKNIAAGALHHRAQSRLFLCDERGVEQHGRAPGIFGRQLLSFSGRRSRVLCAFLAGTIFGCGPNALISPGVVFSRWPPFFCAVCGPPSGSTTASSFAPLISRPVALDNPADLALRRESPVLFSLLASAVYLINDVPLVQPTAFTSRKKLRPWHRPALRPLPPALTALVSSRRRFPSSRALVPCRNCPSCALPRCCQLCYSFRRARRWSLWMSW